MFGWFKRRRAYRMGQEFAKNMRSEIDSHVTLRIIPASQNFVGVFQDCLTTVYDTPGVHPRDMVRIQAESFEENLSEFAGHMRAELNIKSYRWDEIIDQMDLRTEVDHYISHRLDEVVKVMRQKALALANEKLDEIEGRDRASERAATGAP